MFFTLSIILLTKRQPGNFISCRFPQGFDGYLEAKTLESFLPVVNELLLVEPVEVIGARPR